LATVNMTILAKTLVDEQLLKNEKNVAEFNQASRSISTYVSGAQMIWAPFHVEI